MQCLQLIALPLLWAAGGRATCDKYSSTCVQCLSTSGCGWCSTADADVNKSGIGWCTTIVDTALSSKGRENLNNSCNISNYRGPNRSAAAFSTAETRLWYNSTCPLENECENGRHDCDSFVEQCVDKAIGFECRCKDGYKSRNGVCVSVCADGCVNGVCIQPNVCQCNFGFVGSACRSACNCYGHSTCPGPLDLDTCLKCHNFTKGSRCELCDADYIRQGNNCISCREYCHNHSDTCVTDIGSLQSAVNPSPAIHVNGRAAGTGQLVDENALSLLSVPAICVRCSDFTKGLQCEYCLPGYFRKPKSTPWNSCMQCNCNGHSVDNVCNPQRGDGCDCRNNTMTPHGCKDDECWDMQCTTCKDNFKGTPMSNRQCYREISGPDQDACFQPEECSKSKRPRPLNPTELSFFIFKPEFSNVDIRIVLDVGQGTVDAFLAVVDVFSTRYDSVSNCDVLSWRAMGEATNSDRSPFLNGIDDEDETCVPGEGSSWAMVQMKDASDYLASYVIYDSPSSILILRNIANRAVIVAPSTAFVFQATHFYLVIRTRRSSSVGAAGNLLYTQDQAHFDLFVFFAVFFAAFFLALAVALIVWRLKILRAERRHDRAQTVELLKLAKRPIANFAVYWKDDRNPGCSKDDMEIGGGPWPFCFQNLKKKPVTVATVLVQMPGGRVAPVKMALATALIWTGSSAKSNKIGDETAVDNSANSDSTKKRQGRRSLLPSVRCRVQPC